MERSKASRERDRNSAIRPKDSATLIIVRHDSGRPKVLIGRRHERHSFMPGKYVFPGGALDEGDRHIIPAADLSKMVLAKLQVSMRGRPSITRARAIALAAVRETFEEVGLILGSKTEGAKSVLVQDGAWKDFHDLGYSPDLSGLIFFARAITPPGRVRRYDSRFFVVAAERITNLDRPARVANDELLTPHWHGFPDIYGLDLPSITRDILQRLETALKSGGPSPEAPVPFHYLKGKTWHCDHI